MYDYCCQRIIQEYVEEAKKMTIEEISKHIYGIKIFFFGRIYLLKEKR